MRIENSLAAVVLAAGYSSRAPGFKPLLPLGQSTVVENTIQVFRKADINNIIVVVGHHAEELIPLLQRLGVKYVLNESYQEGMYSSVVAGARFLDKTVKAFFLLPADMPLVKSHTIKLISRALKKNKADVVYPVFQGKRGHPPLISRRLIPAILENMEPGGLRNLLNCYEKSSHEAEVLDEGILLDLDTAEDYQQLLRYYHRQIPTPKECEAVFLKLGVPEKVIRHGQAVSNVASVLASRLNAAGLTLDVDLAKAAALLHDVAKGKSDHARLGAQKLRKLGYSKVAKIVAQHTDFVFDEGVIDETAVVYLADKLVKGERLVSITERFHSSLVKYAGNQDVFPIVNQRFLSTQKIAEAAEKIIGMGLTEMLLSVSERQII